MEKLITGAEYQSATTFAENFRRIWLAAGKVVDVRKIPQDGSSGLPRKLGLAVSGGADSMALAYLCRQLELSSENSALGNPFSVTGFVVDHRAREESSREASTVAGWLSGLGIKTQILELDWSLSSPKDKPGNSMPTAFETYARQLRFQALGKACRDSGIEALLMGHHRDDSIETTLLRLAAGASRTGLGGIQEVARIPECHGIFGVSEGTSSIQLSKTQMGGLTRRPLVRFTDRKKAVVAFGPEQSTRSVESRQSLIASGGIFLCRPLLPFPKTMLLETCHQNNVPYVSDPTNFDPTLTPRNAIRAIAASNSLPRALRPASILALEKSSKEFRKSYIQLSDYLLAHRCRILDLNPQAGTMLVEISQFPLPLDPLLGNNTAERIKHIQSLTLRRLTELVSPCRGDRFALRNFEPFVSRVFSSPPGDHESCNIEPKTFTAGGTMVHPVGVNSSAASLVSLYSPLENGRIWLFCRPPFNRRLNNDLAGTRVEIPLPGLEQSSGAPSFGSWLLWDNRFWLRFSLARVQRSGREKHDPPAHKSKTFPLVIRPLQESDMVTIRHGASKNARHSMRLNEILQCEAPGPVRFTLPLLCRAASKESGQEQGDEDAEVLALPTIGHSLSGIRKKNKVMISYEGQQWELAWEWMYKMIDTKALDLMGKP